MRRLTALVACLAVLAAGPAAAQDRPAVFVHGFNASGVDWAPTADRLTQALAIQPRLPSLDWRQTYDQQAVELHGAFGWLHPSAIAVAHSNGGVVAREWSKIRPLGGIATIGTPHRGVPILASLHRWAGFNAATPLLLNRVLNAFSLTTDVTWVWTLVEEAISWSSDYSIWSVFDLAAVIGIETALPVTTQAKPYSEYLFNLNSASNLAREAGAVPQRVGVISIANNFYWAGPARAAVPEFADHIAVALYGSASALLFWSAYIQSTGGLEDPRKFEQAMSLLDVAQHLLTSDLYYCRAISRFDLTACFQNDGLLPDESQWFPGAPNLFIHGPAHTQEKQLGGDVLRDAMLWYLHVPERTGPPPPPSGGSSGGGGGAAVPAPGSPGTLIAGELLRPGESLHSADGRFRLTFQPDGNLVLFDPADQPRWSSQTTHHYPGYLAVQFDGNVVIYDGWDGAVWSTSTHGSPGAYLAVLNDGDVVVFNVDGVARWRSGTGS
jgi:pimeloyl-ACP methyl ester carboxylesterase